jgi:hypothetical protein
MSRAEKLAWAAKNGVEPPAYLLAAEAKDKELAARTAVVAEASAPAKRACCAHRQTPKPIAAKAVNASAMELCGTPPIASSSKRPASGFKASCCTKSSNSVKTKPSPLMGEGGSRSEPGEGFLVENRPHPAFGHLLSEGEGQGLSIGTKIACVETSQNTRQNDVTLIDVLRCRGSATGWVGLTWSVSPRTPLTNFVIQPLVATLSPPASERRLPFSDDPPVPPPRIAA